MDVKLGPLSAKIIPKGQLQGSWLISLISLGTVKFREGSLTALAEPWTLHSINQKHWEHSQLPATMNILHDTGQVEDETPLQQSQAGLGLGVSITSGSLFPGRVRPCQVMVAHGGPRCRVCYSTLSTLSTLSTVHRICVYNILGAWYNVCSQFSTICCSSLRANCTRHKYK